VLMSVGNFLAVLLMVLQVAVEDRRLPAFLTGSTAILLTCATTAVSAVVALAEPVVNLAQSPLGRFVGRVVGTIAKGLNRIGLGRMVRPIIYFLQELLFVIILLFKGVLRRKMHRVAKHKLNEELGSQKLFLYATVLRCAEKWKLKTFRHRLHPSARDRSGGPQDGSIQGFGRASGDASGSRFVLKIHFTLDIRLLGLLSWKMKVFDGSPPCASICLLHTLAFLG